nr:MAG TPA: hypothetical protein [Bacteriophage sp.]
MPSIIDTDGLDQDDPSGHSQTECSVRTLRNASQWRAPETVLAAGRRF